MYEVFAVSALSPRMVSWKQIRCDFAPAVDSVVEAYVKRWAGVLDEPLR